MLLINRAANQAPSSPASLEAPGMGFAVPRQLSCRHGAGTPEPAFAGSSPAAEASGLCRTLAPTTALGTHQGRIPGFPPSSESPPGPGWALQLRDLRFVLLLPDGAGLPPHERSRLENLEFGGHGAAPVKQESLRDPPPRLCSPDGSFLLLVWNLVHASCCLSVAVLLPPVGASAHSPAGHLGCLRVWAVINSCCGCSATAAHGPGFSFPRKLLGMEWRIAG
ncbi:uncharacterized protein LOC119517421 [Choloepus didactylus]|uniref:uncharacterized protein LOC119517421 n=1 Tax=Choloepus didactylus TaxID=27675 RepID=UPI00189F22F5|nr:uncharacterized protein LOC119517421 [Choloepus didactylus]